MPYTVKCPVCGKEWNVPDDSVEQACNCHLYCDEGSEPSDCTMTAVTLNSQVGWPFGLHGSEDSGCDNVMARTYYCTTHKKFTDKRPILIEVELPTGRALKKYRMSEGEY